MFRAISASRARGVAVAVVMLLVFLIVAITTASGLLTSQNYTTGSYREKTMHADFAVKAGVSTAMAKLTEDPAWAPTQASPYEEYLDPNNDIGFQIWIDTNNEEGTAAVTDSEGNEVHPGQVAIKVQALVNGQKVTSGFGGAQQMLVLERPPVEFDHAFFKVTPGILDTWVNSAKVLSYDSSAGMMPFDPVTAPPPANQMASIRSLGDMTLCATELSGEAVLPTNALLLTAVGGSYLTESRLDDSYLPRKFPTKTATGFVTDGVINPGDYDDIYAPSGSTVTFVRGGTYYFADNVDFGNDVTVNLTGPVADGPVKIYFHNLVVGLNAKINIPTSGPPVPGELQFYAVSWNNCDSYVATVRDGAEAAMVLSGQNLALKFGDNVKLYGAFNANRLDAGANFQLHYDEALRAQEFDAKTEWVLVSRGIR